jgi:uncharacterized protein (TIGR02453 family)
MELSAVLKFLASLAKNNNREWFEKNKPVYLQAKANFDEFLVAFLNELVKVDESLATLNPKKLGFRIYRDVRFSKDKSPYKVNMGAGFSPSGKMEQEPGYYLHLQPGNKSFVAAGMYMPEAEKLAKIRQEIDYNSEKLLEILNAKAFKKLFPSLDDFDKLKTAPKGYAKDHPQLELLKHKSFIVSHPFTDEEVKGNKFLKELTTVTKTVMPFKDFLVEAIE